jgi:hypothetical protein
MIGVQILPQMLLYLPPNLCASIKPLNNHVSTYWPKYCLYIRNSYCRNQSDISGKQLQRQDTLPLWFSRKIVTQGSESVALCVCIFPPAIFGLWFSRVSKLYKQLKAAQVCQTKVPRFPEVSQTL